MRSLRFLRTVARLAREIEEDRERALREDADAIRTYAGLIRARADALESQPWTRIPRALGHNGHVARMTGAEARTYLALVTVVDVRTLGTLATLETLAERSGLHPDTVRAAMRFLKRRGLLSRRQVAWGEGRSLWRTRLLPRGACADEAERGTLTGSVL